MLKEKLKKFGEYILVTIPLWAPISVFGLDYLTSKHIDGYSIRQYNNSTVVRKGHGIQATTELRDNDNNGTIDEKIIWAHFPRKPVLPLKQKVTEEDQKIYEGLLSKL